MYSMQRIPRFYLLSFHYDCCSPFSLSIYLSLSLSLSLSLEATLWIAQLQQTLTNYALFPKCWMQQIIILIIMTHLILELITHLMCLGEWFSMLWKMWFKWLISKLQFICYKCKKHAIGLKKSNKRINEDNESH